ncbi:ABC transporter permease [Halobacterium yunchengense]|uniref:ABC transporter permease n=1 Tax=Halobacterium yunchengense TaxID=3108497 RepID=UPI00300A736D
MSYASFVARRAAFAVLAAFVVVSITFAVVVSMPNVQLGAELASAERAGASDAEIEQIREEFWERRGGEAGALDRYVDRMTGIVTLDWGTSYELQRPVTAVIADRLPYTLAYVVPGVALSFIAGSLFGVASAFRRNGAFDRTSRLTAYLLMGVPTFWVVHYLNTLHPWTMPWLEPTLYAFGGSPRVSQVWAFDHPARYALPSVVLALGLAAGLLQHSRAESLEYERRAFVKLVRAKGAGRLRVARHVLRNAAIPILTLSFVEVLGVLMLNVYIVEAVFDIPGLGSISLFAIKTQDLPLIVGSTLVLVFIGIGGNLLQDLLYGYLDPTIRED